MHITGHEVNHTGGVEIEARKQRNVDLISFDMVIKIKVVKFEFTTEHSNISSYCYTWAWCYRLLLWGYTEITY